MNTNPIIKIENLHKTYVSGFIKKRRTQALKGVNLQIFRGEIFGILGPNGAGKTTLMNVLSSQLVADSGSISIMGIDVSKNFPNRIKKKLNMSSGNPNFHWCMTVEEILKFYSLLYGVCKTKCRIVIEKCLETFDLKKYSKTRYDELSTGTKQKLSLAKALLNDPEILLLDEPTIGLDPDVAIRIRNFIKKIHAETKITILLTTHYMKEAEELCQRIAFLVDGYIVAIGSREELQKITKKNDLEGVFLELVKNLGNK